MSVSRHFRSRTLRTQYISGTIRLVPKCPDSSAQVPKCLEDTSALVPTVSTSSKQFLLQQAVQKKGLILLVIIINEDHCGMTNYRIGRHRTTSDYVCKREIVISKAKPKSAGISWSANKPPVTQLAHYNLGLHKCSIRSWTSVVYISPSVRITV